MRNACSLERWKTRKLLYKARLSKRVTAQFMFQREKLKSEFSENLRAMFSTPTLAVAVAAFILFVLAGPFGTFKDLALGPRALFWGLVVSVSVLTGYISRAVATLAVGHERPAWFDAVALGVMTLLLSPAVWIIGRMFEPVFVVKMASFLEIFLCVLSVALIVFVLRRLIPGFKPRSYPFIASEDGALSTGLEAPRLLRRLPSETRGKVLRLSARDHHVDIVTRLGVETLRMRLVDAISEMEPVEGYCAHRSHWVARSAITRIERENAQKAWLVLANGDRVPVSRKYRQGLLDAGIL